MRTIAIRAAAALAALMVLALPLAAQDKPMPTKPADTKSMEKPMEANTMAPAAAPAYPAGIRGEYLRQLDEAAKQMVDLAEAIPADKFTWRPAPGVRSVAEVCLHVAAGNFGILQAVGVPLPEGVGDPRKLESTTTEKAKVVETLRASLDHLRKAAMGVSDADLEKTTKLFGQDMSYRAVYMLLSNHLHEHLGQSIAYARMNGVVPPWSAGGS